MKVLWILSFLFFLSCNRNSFSGITQSSLKVDAVSSFSDGVNGFDALSGAHKVTTVVIGGNTYALAISGRSETGSGGFQIIDISKTSLNLTKIFLSSFFKKKKVNIKYILGDFLKKKIDMKYDIIVCGEVLEHVADPIKFMKKVHYHLNNKGKVFISTCINCPAIDHVNQWYNIEEIRKIFKSICN